MQDLERLALFLNKKYGFQCYQIAIHRDEGHINEQGQKEINHHAHLEFITLNKENGRNMWRRELITPKVLRQMQSEVAEILGMQRGQDKRITKRQRIEPRKYAQMKEA
ncbi:TPA: mobilization protein, partial [Campylobacter coli]|nr:mobilization protein [Campylobacter coli]HEH5491999.1 mobilization protein [Campylobacter coli]